MILNTYSLFGYNWQLLNEDPNLSAFEKILKNRDLTEETSSPWDYPDMEKVTKRIEQAIGNNERIMIFGDYDADGITATSILFRVLKELGAQVSYRIPHREDDGYGLNMAFIDEFIEANVKLLITVDCGIACPNEVEKATKNGIDVIVTDHHDIPLKPAKPYALIHSNHLAGAGVAYKLAEALLGEEAEKYIDLAAIGTIADIVPLTGENRVIAKKGLQQMAKTSWLGLKSLIRISRIDTQDLLELDSSTVGYRIGPRINASGRLADPYLSLQVLVSDDPKIDLAVAKLNQINIDRQEMVKEIIESLEYDENDSIIIVKGEWPKGVLGLIAGRITEKTGRPSIAFAEYEDTLTGSARSPEFFHITEAFKKLDKYLDQYGGHRKAAGLTLKKENFQDFKRELQKLLKQEDIPQKSLQIDTEIMPHELDEEFYKNMESLKPFGEQNQSPKLLLNDVEIVEVKMVGANGNHLKINGKFGPLYISGIKFDVPTAKIESKKISIVAELKKDSYAKSGYSLMIADIAESPIRV